MAKKKDLLSFLFVESAEAESRQGDRLELSIAADLEHLFEAVAEAEASELEAKATPLAKALSSFGITDADLQLDPEGFVIVTDNHDKYVDTCTILGSADAMHKLAEMGWVVTKPGDVAMTNEPAEYRIRFLEITTVEADDREPKAGGYDTANREEVIKKAQKFASTPMDRDDDSLNPVENGTGKMGPKAKGVGKEKDGATPEKAIHDSVAAVSEMTTTGSMGTLIQGAPGEGIVKKPKPYGKGTPFKMPGQWTVKQPVVNKQVKRKVHSESAASAEQAAKAFLKEALGEAGELEFEDSEPTEPQEEDITTGDHHTFFQVGATRGPWLEVPMEWEWEQTAAAIRQKMEDENFFPNVWFVSDHGNAHLMTNVWPNGGAAQGAAEDFRERHAGGDVDAINQAEQ